MNHKNDALGSPYDPIINRHALTQHLCSSGPYLHRAASAGRALEEMRYSVIGVVMLMKKDLIWPIGADVRHVYVATSLFFTSC